MASNAPHAKPANARGKRSVRTISAARSADAPCEAGACNGESASITLDGASDTLPNASDAINTTSAASASTSQMAAARFALMAWSVAGSEAG